MNRGVQSVTVSPSTASVSKGQNLQLSAVVATKGIVNQGVIWSIPTTAENDHCSIDQLGVLHVGADTTQTSITVTAKSVWNPSKKATATITVV